MTSVMSKKFLGTAIAGAALGGPSLLFWAPSTALFDRSYHPDGYQEYGSGGSRLTTRIITFGRITHNHDIPSQTG